MNTDKEKQRVKQAIESLQKYINTYDQQYRYQYYSDETIINDILYGLGVALEPEKYKFHDGFCKFKDVLREHLELDRHPARPYPKPLWEAK
jgi:hypothetical protein